MFQTLRLIFTPLLCLIILTLGNGLLTTYLSLRLHELGSSNFAIGSLTTVYYLGMTLAAFKTEQFIYRVGHIRAYAAFASLLAVTTMLHGIYIEETFWIVLRLLDGFAVGGLYVAIESWILTTSQSNNRGKIIALYMLALYLSQAGGQFLLNIGHLESFIPYAIATILASLSVIPLAMTKTESPQFEEPSHLSPKRLFQASPSGVITCLISGLILGSIYGLLPIYIADGGYSINQLSLLMGLTIFGGMALQYPIGRISDKISRRSVISILGLLISAVSLLLIFITNGEYFYYIFCGLLFILGGATFTLYPVGISHACDRVEQKDIVSITQGLLLAYSVGAMSGPIVASLFMYLFNSAGLMVFFIVFTLPMSAFLLWRKSVVEAPAVEDKQDFTAATTTTPIVNEIDPRSSENIE
ncbi:MFS transporter [Thiotrichales bacterium 19S11-10]|nr:MFS transporter [Thiotrichales bacterium 19S11-10]MCF6808486.1 MFS transporter [Thiotrichales bacterium 19S9-11]MCF6812456.1 MFS transporter [Thiotrichales bacterium 19S9-12]